MYKHWRLASRKLSTFFHWKWSWLSPSGGLWYTSKRHFLSDWLSELWVVSSDQTHCNFCSLFFLFEILVKFLLSAVVSFSPWCNCSSSSVVKKRCLSLIQDLCPLHVFFWYFFLCTQNRIRIFSLMFTWSIFNLIIFLFWLFVSM